MSFLSLNNFKVVHLRHWWSVENYLDHWPSHSLTPRTSSVTILFALQAHNIMVYYKSRCHNYYSKGTIVCVLEPFYNKSPVYIVSCHCDCLILKWWKTCTRDKKYSMIDCVENKQMFVLWLVIFSSASTFIFI